MTLTAGDAKSALSAATGRKLLLKGGHIVAIFTTAEIQRRWSAVLDNLGEEQCIVVPSFHNSYYLSGFPMPRYGRFLVTILFKSGEPVLIAPDFERDSVVIDSPIQDLRTYRDQEGPTQPVVAKLIAEALRERGVTICATEGEGLPVSLQNLLTTLLPEVTFVDRTDAVDLVRMVSSEEELVYLREAARLADIGLQRVRDLLAPGVSETEISRAAQDAMKEAASSDYGFAVSCFLQQGERSAACHAGPADAVIEDGQFVEVNVEAEVNHYQAAVERPFVIGELPENVRKACEVAHDAYEAALHAVKPGARFGDVDLASRKVLQDAGYDRITNGAGLVRALLHESGGRMELGDLRLHNDQLIKPGMAITVEPWAIAPGVGGPRVCNHVVVTDDGVEMLTKTAGGTVRDAVVAGKVG